MEPIMGKDVFTDIILQCDCSEISHLIKFSYLGDENYEDEFMYVATGMDTNIGFFHRLKNAFKYLFKLGECNWVFGDTVLLPSDIRDLTNFLQKYNDYITKHNMFR